MGMITAHYGVEGDGFYGFTLAKWLPYSVTRTWHVQTGHLLDRHGVAGGGSVHRAAGERHEPKCQRLGVNVLFGALLIVVAGSMTGQWLSIRTG